MYCFPSFEPVHCSMSGSNCCFLTRIQISPGAGQVVWYSCLLKNLPQFVVIYTVKAFGIISKASLSFTISQSLLKLMCIKSVVPSNHLILCHSLLLPSIFPSIRVFFNELTLHFRCPKSWNFSFSISPSNEYSGLIFFSID